MKILGINALFHDPAAALVVDGRVVAAAEEERFSRRKHGKRPVPFSAWELPEQAARWCLAYSGIGPDELDAVGYSFDPALAVSADELGLDDPWDELRLVYARRAPEFLATALPGLDPQKVVFVPHHVAHAASAGLTVTAATSDVLVLDGRGESTSHLAGVYENGKLSVLATQRLPNSLGLLYEDVTAHLGFLRSSDEYKVMALASYGTPRFAGDLRDSIGASGDGGFYTHAIDWVDFVPPLTAGEAWTREHADLAASVQLCVEDVLIDLARWLKKQGSGEVLTMAGGVALNCVANTRIAAESDYSEVWVQPAAGDAGTALGAALHIASEQGAELTPMTGADLGREWTEDEIESVLRAAHVHYERPADIAAEAAQSLSENGIVAWFQGRSEFGPRALGHRSLLAHPGNAENLDRLNDVKGREQFRPVAPMVLEAWASKIFRRGPTISPYMLFVHDVAEDWRDRIPAVVHVDGTARVQTVTSDQEPLVARLLERFHTFTGLPLVVNTSLNTAGRPMVDSPRDALECFGSAPIDLLAIGPFVVRRREAY